MTNADIIRTLVEFSLAITVVIIFINEKKLITFENRIIAKIKNWINSKQKSKKECWKWQTQKTLPKKSIIF